MEFMCQEPPFGASSTSYLGHMSRTVWTGCGAGALGLCSSLFSEPGGSGLCLGWSKAWDTLITCPWGYLLRDPPNHLKCYHVHESGVGGAQDRKTLGGSF